MHRRVRRMRQEFLRVTAGNHRPRFRVDEYAVVADGENTRSFMRDHHDRGPKLSRSSRLKLSSKRELMGSRHAEGADLEAKCIVFATEGLLLAHDFISDCRTRVKFGFHLTLPVKAQFPARSRPLR